MGQNFDELRKGMSEEARRRASDKTQEELKKMPTTVVHCKKESYDVYIGRPSIFGNPYTIGKDGDREEVLVAYQVYFDKRIESDKEFRDAVEQLKGKRLGCWCKPLACHGDIIAEYLDS